MQKTTDEIYKWINSPEGQKALQESHDKTEQYLKEFHNKEWNLQDWINLMFTPYQQITDLQAEIEQGKKAIELVKECDEYLDSFYKINSIRTSCSLHIKMKELLQPDGLTKGERG